MFDKCRWTKFKKYFTNLSIWKQCLHSATKIGQSFVFLATVDKYFVLKWNGKNKRKKKGKIWILIKRDWQPSKKKLCFSKELLYSRLNLIIKFIKVLLCFYISHFKNFIDSFKLFIYLLFFSLQMLFV